MHLHHCLQCDNMSYTPRQTRYVTRFIQLVKLFSQLRKHVLLYYFKHVLKYYELHYLPRILRPYYHFI